MATKRKRKQQQPDEGLTSEDLENAPLFESSSAIAYISVSRVEPDEGFLGQVPATASEATIFRKWGGGTFKVTPRAAGGQYIPKIGPREVSIAGDPIFKSLAKQRAWERQNGMGSPDAGAGREKSLGFGELFMLISKTSEQARQEAREAADLRMKEADINHQRQLEILREEAKRREHELELERRRLDTEAKEKTERLDREMKAERERQREHSAAMLQLVQERSKDPASNPIDTLMAGIKLAMDLRPGGDGGETSDPLTALAQNLPDTIEQLGRVVAMEKAGSSPPRANPARKRRDDGDDDDGTVAFEGPVGERASRLYKTLEKRGLNEAQIAAVFARGFDVTERLYAGQRSAPPAQATSKPRGRRPKAAAAAPAARSRAAARRPTPRPPKSPEKRKPATP
jgi:hypothetical protein